MDQLNNLPRVLGVGNALVDVIVQLENEKVLQEFGLLRGSMTLVDADLSDKIDEATSLLKKEMSTGGSVANTMRTLTNMGANCGYMGKIGKDDLGKLFKDEFEKKSIKTHLLTSETNTGRVMGMVSPDSERTMATFLGAAVELNAQDFSTSIFEGYDYLYMEGYLVQNHELIKTGVEMAKKMGLKVAIDLSSFNVVEENLDFLTALVKNSVDIVFANEEEAASFTGKEPEEALDVIADMCEIAIVKVGKDGSFIKKGDRKYYIEPVLAKAIDTTGAGDSYAAGFFYGLTCGYELQKCGDIAAYVSSKVVEVMGANLPDNSWTSINRRIQEL